MEYVVIFQIILKFGVLFLGYGVVAVAFSMQLPISLILVL